MIALFFLACGFIVPAQILADVRQHDRWAREDAEYREFMEAIRSSEVQT